MSLIRVLSIPRSEDTSFTNGVNKILTTLQQYGHTVQVVWDVYNAGLSEATLQAGYSFADSPPSSSPGQSAIPSVILQITDVYLRHKNLGDQYQEALAKLGSENSQLLFLIIHFVPEGDSIRIASTSNVWYWIVRNSQDLEFFDARALGEAIKSFTPPTQLRTKEEREEHLQRVETRADEFVQEAQKTLRNRQHINFEVSLACYLLGFAAFVLGALALFYSSHESIKDALGAALALGRTVGIISVMAVAVKYCADLGKAFMRESLRNADRIHAINFGMFYLRSFGDEATWPDIKDAFSQWNIDQQTAFSDIKSDYDPKALEMVASLLKIATKKE